MKSWPNVATKQLQSRKKVQKKVETWLAKKNLSLLIWDRSLKVMLQHPTMWFDWKQSKYLSKKPAFIWCFAQEVDCCLKDCDKQRLQTTVSINLWKIFAGHTGDWFDVRTASICTTDLWDALKSFILNSLKFKVAPYRIIVSLDTLSQTAMAAMVFYIEWNTQAHTHIHTHTHTHTHT